MKETVLKIKVNVTGTETLAGKDAYVNMVSFGGDASSPYFEGTVCPGGVDVQMSQNGSPVSLSARYMLSGKDACGKDCRIYIENEGEAGKSTTSPRIVTSSEALSWLGGADLEGTLSTEEGGLTVTVDEVFSGFDLYEHTFEAKGKRIYGEIYRPRKEGRLPLVIASHGYGGCSLHMRAELEKIAKRGVAVYAYDFCGGGNFSKSSGETTEMSIKTEIEDLSLVIEEALSLDFIDTDRVYLYGASQGGFVSGLTAPAYKDKLRGLFLIFPAFCIPDHWAEAKAKNDRDVIEFWGVKLGRKFVEELPDYDVFARAAEYEGRVFIFNGDVDGIVTLDYAERLRDSYKNAVLTVFPGQGHGFAHHFQHIVAGSIAKTVLN